jgi:ATP-dependent Clp protease ATP-binding subunit ClpA
LKRCIEKEISTPLANALLREDISNNSKVKVTIKNNKPVFSFETDFFKSDEHKEMANLEVKSE